jgi:hypothetical protein
MGSTQRAMFVGARTRRTFRVQRLRDADEALAGRVTLEDADDDGGLLRLDDAHHVRALTRRTEHRLVAVAEDDPADDVAVAEFRAVLVPHPLLRLRPLNLVGEGRRRQRDLIRRAVEGALGVGEVEEHPHAGLHDLLEHIRRLDRLAAEARPFRHHQHVERSSARLQHVQQLHEAATLRELHTADA